MWEAIRANRRRSVLLILTMAALLVGLGYAIGMALAPHFAYLGVGVAAVVWAFLWIAAVSAGDGLMLGSVHARRIQHDDYPVLFNVVEEMTIASGLPKMPRVYIIDSDAPNAFAVGKEDRAVVAVTSGLLMRLTRDELQGVVAHEIGHIKNHDTRFMVLAGVMMGAIILVADVFVRGVFHGAGTRRGGRRGRGGGQAAVLLVALAFAILAPIIARLLYFACSRRREYLADASAARFTRYPEGLASALQKIAAAAGRMEKVSRTVAPMFTVNPLKASGASGLFSTHPPTAERVRVLRAMGGAAFADYEAAFRRTVGERVIGERTLAGAEAVGLREPSAEPQKEDLARAREAVDILHRINGLLFLACACGLKIKVPPQFEADTIRCPRCSRELAVPVAAMAAATAGAGEAPPGEYRPADVEDMPQASAFSYRYRPGEWQSFRCPCGWTVNLSPSFSGDHTDCPGCGRRIAIRRA